MPALNLARFATVQTWTDDVHDLGKGEASQTSGETGEAASLPGPAELIHITRGLTLGSAGSGAGRARTALFAALSLLLHSGAMAAVLLAIEPTDIGAVTVPSEAISVEIVSSSVLESMQQKETTAEAANAATDAKAGDEPSEASTAASKLDPPKTDADKPATSETEKVAAADTSIKEAAPEKSLATEHSPPKPLSEEEAPMVAPPPPVTDPQSAHDESENGEAERARELAEQARREAREREEQMERKRRERELAEERRKQEEKREARERDEEREEHRRKAEKGGATSRATAATASAGRASASTGSMLTYASRVRAHVAARKPSGAGWHGTAVVAFGITTSGRLSYASVSRSSGNAALDRLAVSAVRGAAPFPDPPTGASPSQLRFTIPFHFQ